MVTPQFDQLFRVNGVALRAMTLGGGARLLSGTVDPTSSVTAAGYAGPGSLYFVTTPSRWKLFENTGTKLAPTWTLRYDGSGD
jgi:hypothetical protein